MTIRPARPEDAPVLSELALRAKGHWGYDAAFLDVCRTDLALTPGDVASRIVRVAEGSDGSIVGFSALIGSPPEGELDALFVDPPAIGRGIGRLLWKDALAQARALGFECLLVESDPNAEDFYQRMGAVRVGLRESPIVRGRQLPLLRVDLAGVERVA